MGEKCRLGKHPYSMKSLAEDAFRAAEASLFDEKFAEGCFSSGGSISIRWKIRCGMLFERRIHPYSEEFVAKDYFPETEASLFDEKFAEGCFPSGEYIPIR